MSYFMRNCLALLFLSLSSIIYSQNKYSVDTIPSELLIESNAVIRFDETMVTLNDFDNMTVGVHSIVTVLNKRGLKAISPIIHYDNSTSIKNYEAYLYNAKGEEVKKYKKKDFIDVSASGSNLYSDSKVKVLEFTPAFYPFTFEFVYEIKTSSTILFPGWLPLSGSHVSVEDSEYKVFNPKNISIKIREFNLEKFGVKNEKDANNYSYKVKNIPAIKFEYLAPHYSEFLPLVRMSPRKFQLENTPGEIETWKDFGLWQNQELLKGRDEISEQTKGKISNLVADMDSTEEKVKAIYQYMQNKTRYISIQIGIGGWQPTPAEEVDRLSYGDCKGLTNYTMALLKSQGIESYYTIVDSQEDGRDLDEDFVALQGDHVILTVPIDGENVFLECTNQQLPYNFLGTHTDDRKVLMVTPEGGVITRTHKYTTKDNVKSLTANVIIKEDFEISGIVKEVSEGLEYDEKYFLESYKKDDLSMYYKETWGHLNNLLLDKITLHNNKETVAFTEEIQFKAYNYVSKAGERILLNPNFFNRVSFIPLKENNRKNPLEIRRGYTNKDEINITIPNGYQLESLFQPIELTTQFGSYKSSIEIIEPYTLRFKRELILNSGKYPKEAYNDFVDFVRYITQKDKSKIVLSKK
jgi:hypothetical protein